MENDWNGLCVCVFSHFYSTKSNKINDITWKHKSDNPDSDFWMQCTTNEERKEQQVHWGNKNVHKYLVEYFTIRHITPSYYTYYAALTLCIAYMLNTFYRSFEVWKEMHQVLQHFIHAKPEKERTRHESSKKNFLKKEKELAFIFIVQSVSNALHICVHYKIFFIRFLNSTCVQFSTRKKKHRNRDGVRSTQVDYTILRRMSASYIRWNICYVEKCMKRLAVKSQPRQFTASSIRIVNITLTP